MMGNLEESKFKCLAMDIDGTLKEGGINTNTKYEIIDNCLRVSVAPLNDKILSLFNKLRKRELIVGGCSGWDLESMNNYLGKLDFQIAENGAIVQINDKVFFPEEIYGEEINARSERINELKKRYLFRYDETRIKPFKSDREFSLLIIYAQRDFFDDFHPFSEQCKQIADEYKCDVNFFRKNRIVNGKNIYITGVEYTIPLINKKNALFFLFRKIGILPERAVYFGDSYNDLDIFRSNVGLKVAPKGAKKEIIELADLLVSSPPFGIFDLKKKLGY